jgi:hypothetical protein
MASPEVRIRNIATFMIVISGLFLLAGLAAWWSSGPVLGEFGKFSDAMKRNVLLPCGIIGALTGAGLLFRRNWGRTLMVGICALTCVFALLLLVGLSWMPLGTEPGESTTSLLILKLVCLLFVAAPVLVPIFWIKFLTSKEVSVLFHSRPVNSR